MLLILSTAVHPKDQKAEKHSDAHQGNGSWGSEELPVVDTEVPHYGQHHHKHRHHQTTGAQCHTCSSDAPADAGSWPREGCLLGAGVPEHLRDMAVDHTFICDVEGQEGPFGILEQLALVDQLDLTLPTREVFAGRKKNTEM